ncbi:MAG: hypothetical protein O3A51_12635, partial [Verrucomicrobia bacterium]|nr:hypothetical protein [Verrucomicrobiota bacterium]
MKRHLLVGLMVGGLAASSLAHGVDHTDDRFQARDNVAAGGFFWIDTTNGNIWWARTGIYSWKFVGKPEGAKAGKAGTYMARENNSGAGLFILNTETGQAWWTDGNTWRAFGVPAV